MAQQTAFARQAHIISQLAVVMTKVDESVRVSQENGTELKLLRRELGLDGQHGRLPIVETTLIRHEARMEKSELRIDKLEIEHNEATGAQKRIAALWAVLGGGAGAAVIALLDHLLVGGH